MKHESLIRPGTGEAPPRRTKGGPSAGTAQNNASDEVVDELRRCLSVASAAILDANRILNRADGLIEALRSTIESRRPTAPLNRAVAEHPPASRFLRAREVILISGLSRTTIWRLERGGDFPRHVQITPGRIGWPVEDVEAWVAARRGR